jgi:hypothetical protein
MVDNNMSRIDLLKKIGKEFPNGKGVEIGTFKGEFSKEIMENWSGTLYMVDVWRPLPYEEYLDISNHGQFENGVYVDAMDNIKGYENRAIMVRASSEIASDMFEDNSLDFVYIDANHAYDYVVQDINLWYPKIKKGGYLCGHDYLDMNWYSDPNFDDNKKDKHIYNGDIYHGVFGVNPAVDEFCEENDYELQITNEWFGTWLLKKKVISSKHYDFIEIGTSDFNTLLEDSNDDTVGLSIEPIKFYQDNLPNKKSVKKVSAAVSDDCGFIDIYYIPDNKIQEHSLPWWVRGCNSVNQQHDFVRDFIGNELYDSIVTIDKVPTITWSQIIKEYNVGSIKTLKVDTEGYDHVIINEYFKECEKNPSLYADVIQFEYNQNSNVEEIEKIISSVKGYKIEHIADDIILTKLKPNKNIAVLVIYDENYETMKNLTVDHNIQQYCDLHGYTLIACKINSTERSPQWYKIHESIDVLKSNEFEWLFFIDLDCLIMNPTIRLESIIDDNYSFIIPSQNTPSNDTPIITPFDTDNIITSQFLVKNDEFGIKILEDIWEAKELSGNFNFYEFDHEQRQTKITIQKEEFKPYVKIIEEKTLNRFWYMNSPFMTLNNIGVNDLVWKPGDFIVHVTGYKKEEKIKLLSDLNYFSGGAIVNLQVKDNRIKFKPILDLDYIKLKIKDFDDNLIYEMEYKNLNLNHIFYLDLPESIKEKSIRLEGYDKINNLISLHKLGI